ncbi:MAG: G5 domain-containing protein [Candidatus Saccharibacteria bacterium]|nr:G5 domain-containing protein [Candidatus Saccharibacteria bacterium]
MKCYVSLLRRPRTAIVVTGAVSAVILLVAITATAISQRVAALHGQATVYEYAITHEEAVPFETEVRKSYTHHSDVRQIEQPGVAGTRQVTYRVVARGDGAELSRELIDDQVVQRPVSQIELHGARSPQALTKQKSAQIFTDSRGVAHRETYYDLPMSVVMGACGAGGRYSVRADGAKVDKDGFVIVAANFGNYPRCSVVETSMGPGKVYDTGGFAVRHPHGFDLATDWTNGDGR